MKTISANLKLEIESGAPNIASCVKVERVDGTIFTFTDWPEVITFDGEDYQPAGGYQRTAIDQQEGLNVDTMDIMGVFTDTSITDDDIMSGRFRDAKVWFFLVSPDNISYDEIKLDYGKIGEITIHDNHYVAEFRDLMSGLSQNLGNKFSRYCRHKLGESEIVSGVEMKCGIILEPDVRLDSTAYAVNEAVRAAVYDERRYVAEVIRNSGVSDATPPTFNTTIGSLTSETDIDWRCYDAYTKEGTVTSVTNDFIFTDSSLTDDDDTFTDGELIWTTGINTGLIFDVKSSLDTGEVTLKQPLFNAIQVGHKFKITVGCNHILKMPDDVKGTPYTGDCRVKFSPETSGNAKNYGGEPELLNADRLTAPADTVE